MSARLLAVVLALFAVLAIPGAARAQQPQSQAAKPGAAPPTYPAESWAGQLDSLQAWLEARRGPGACTERCYTLERLALSGSVEAGSLDFTLEGGVLAEGPVAVPLFGPPSKVRIDGVTENGKVAAVGFESDHYFVFTRARRFVIKGSIGLQGDLALEIVGPVNSLEASLSTGRVVEGARMSGLANTTIHFDAATGDGATVEPTVFQLSRAVRIGRAIDFEYHLVMRSGKDLGVARLPLRFGEKVLDVSGSSGWSIDGGDLVLPTAGHIAQMTITGTLPNLGAFAPDDRSPYEWWLIESDAEHRMTVNGDAAQVESSQSPISRTQPTSRLFLVQKGQHIDVSVQALVSTEVLAAVVRNHARTVVLTSRGDLVADDSITYENNGIDYLMLSPAGREIYLSTDGKAERIMQQQDQTGASSDVLVPLLVGSHTIHGQSLSSAQLHAFAGVLAVPTPTYPITASHVSVTVGLPENVHPVAVLGGDHAQWFVGWADLAAVISGFAASWLAFRTRPRRVLGGIVLGGLWLLAAPAYVLAMGALVITAGVWVLARLVPRRHFAGVAVALATLAGFVCLCLSVASFGMRKASHEVTATATTGYAAPAASQQAFGGNDADGQGNGVSWHGEENAREASKTDLLSLNGDYRANPSKAGVVQGVTPVALGLPSYDHGVSASRELVTHDRAFSPSIVYVTTAALLPFGAAWLLALLLLVGSHRSELVLLVRRIRARLAAGADWSAAAPVAPLAAAAAAAPAEPSAS